MIEATGCNAPPPEPAAPRHGGIAGKYRGDACHACGIAGRAGTPGGAACRTPACPRKGLQDPEPIPRPDLFLNKDAEAWREQFRFLRYTVRMTPERIAQIDYGFDPDHPEAWASGGWGAQIERLYPRVDVAQLWRKEEG